MYKPSGPPKAKLSIRLAKWQPFPGSEEVTVPDRLSHRDENTGKLLKQLFVSPEAVLTNADIVGTSFTRHPKEEEWGTVQIVLTAAGRERLALTSREHLGSSLAIFVGDKLESLPTMTSELPDGVAELTGFFRGTEGHDLAQRLVGLQPPVAAQETTHLLAPVHHAPFLGTWVVESFEALGEKAPAEDAGDMKLTFHPDKATWHFRLPDGWKSFDGTLRYDPTSEPKTIDLSQPNNPGKVALGIYKIEGDKLTISMGAERPKSFEEPSLTKLVFQRE